MAKFRDTFSNDHPDIIKSFLDTRVILEDDYKRRFIKFQNCDYILHCDATVRKTLEIAGEAYCLVSYQQRKTGYYAIARIHRNALSDMTFSSSIKKNKGK